MYLLIVFQPQFLTSATANVVSFIVIVIHDLYLWKFYTEIDLCLVLLLFYISL
jgi:hypothetical protein